jgi:hypothetical protein
MPSLQGDAAPAKCCSERPRALPRFASWMRPDPEAFRACPGVSAVPVSVETCPDRRAHLARCRWPATGTSKHRAVYRSQPARSRRYGPSNHPVPRSEHAGAGCRGALRFDTAWLAGDRAGPGMCTGSWPCLRDWSPHCEPRARAAASGSQPERSDSSPAVRIAGLGAIIESTQGMVLGGRGSGRAAARTWRWRGWRGRGGGRGRRRNRAVGEQAAREPGGG